MVVRVEHDHRRSEVLDVGLQLFGDHAALVDRDAVDTSTAAGDAVDGRWPRPVLCEHVLTGCDEQLIDQRQTVLRSRTHEYL